MPGWASRPSARASHLACDGLRNSLQHIAHQAAWFQTM